MLLNLVHLFRMYRSGNNIINDVKMIVDGCAVMGASAGAAYVK